MGTKAFGESSLNDDFAKLYQALHNWQVFRRSVRHWSEEETFDAFIKCGRQFAELGGCRDRQSGLASTLEAIESMQDIKTNKIERPSVVAVSKFLHFWNPRLFVIVDDGVVWKWVFAHDWLRQQVRLTRTRLKRDCLRCCR